MQVSKPSFLPSGIASSVSLINAGLTFSLAFSYLEAAILTVTRADMTVDETADKLSASFVVPGTALAAALGEEASYNLQWQFVVSPETGGDETLQGSALVLPALP